MKTHNNLQFFKSKSFYVVLAIAVVAIAAVTVVGLRLSPDKKKENLADLNTPINVAQEDGSKVEADLNDAANKEAASNETNDKLVEGQYTNDDLLQYDVESFSPENKEETVDQNQGGNHTQIVENEKNTTDTEKTAEENKPEEETVEAMQPSASADSLSFNQDSVMAWPVKGNVILPFSMENLVHYATLGEWKTNPAIIISSETGTEVKASVKGIVSNIDYNEETGTRVTMNIGNGYEVIYGQLSEVACEKGDIIEQGTVIGKVADPTKYYSVEGSNLYLEVLCDGKPVNPMLYLAGEE